VSPDIKAPGLDEARAALARVDAACAEYGWTADDGMSSDHLRSALTVADRLAAENARLREALAWALGEGPDPGAWPDGVEVPAGYCDPDDVWLLKSELPHAPARGARMTAWIRRTCAARRILVEVRDGR